MSLRGGRKADAAIHLRALLDCFAALAMTAGYFLISSGFNSSPLAALFFVIPSAAEGSEPPSDSSTPYGRSE
jgi:hypothetical protein